MPRRQAIIVTIVCILMMAIIIKINQCMQYRPPIVQTQIPSVFQLQQQLKDLGFYKGDVDGVIGPQTLAAWQEAVYRQQFSDIEKRIEKSQKNSAFIQR